MSHIDKERAVIEGQRAEAEMAAYRASHELAQALARVAEAEHLMRAALARAARAEQARADALAALPEIRAQLGLPYTSTDWRDCFRRARSLRRMSEVIPEALAMGVAGLMRKADEAPPLSAERAACIVAADFLREFGNALDAAMDG